MRDFRFHQRSALGGSMFLGTVAACSLLLAGPVTAGETCPTGDSGLYRAVQGLGTQTARVGIERNIADAAATFGFNDHDNNIAGDGWSLVGRTNGAGSNGACKYFFLNSAIPTGVPVVRIEQLGGTSRVRCVETSPMVNRHGLSEVRIGQTRIMEPVAARADGECLATGVLGTGSLDDYLVPGNTGSFPLGAPTVQINAGDDGTGTPAGQFSIRYPKDSVNTGRQNARIAGRIVCLNPDSDPIQVGGQVETSNASEWPQGSYVRFAMVDNVGAPDFLNYTIGENAVPDCVSNPMTDDDIPVVSGNFSDQQ